MNPRPSELLLPAMYRILHEATPGSSLLPITIKPPKKPLWPDQEDFLACRSAHQWENLGIHLVSHHSTCTLSKTRGKGKKKEELSDDAVGKQLTEMVETSIQRLGQLMKIAKGKYEGQDVPHLSEHLEAGACAWDIVRRLLMFSRRCLCTLSSRR